jgi:hypothetical protein
MSESHTPDASQLGVINFDARGKLVVTAGPGSGKTYTAALRASKIIDQVEDGLPILAISFSRAAAYAIRRACWNGGCRTGIRFSTLDGWARSFVTESGLIDEIDRNVQTFDVTIEHATQILRADNSDSPMFSHLLIDEAQDVTGKRRELVLELMKRSSMGWTLLGDLAQKIFDFNSDFSREPIRAREKLVAQSVDREVREFVLPSGLLKVLDCVPVDVRDGVVAALQNLHESGPPSEAAAHQVRTLDTNSNASTVWKQQGDTTSILELVISKSSTDPTVHHLKLTEDHRSRTSQLKSLRSLGELIRGDHATEAIVDTIWSEYRSNKNVVRVNLDLGKAPIDELSGKLRYWGNLPESTIVLVKTRADLLSISRHLCSPDVAVPYDLIPTRDEDLIPPWVGGFAGAITVEELRERIPEGLDREVIMSMMKSQFVKGNRFDEDALVQTLRMGRVPEYFKTRVFAGVLLSTIHRVKGLEFDRVFLGGWNRPEDDSLLLNESRLMFVGLTRAASENWALEFSSRAIFDQVPSDRSRLLEKRYVGRSKMAVGIEVKNSDIRLLRPIPDSVEPVLHLETRQAGAPVRYFLGNADGSSEYGFTLDRFGEAVNVALGGKNMKVPDQLRGLLRVGTCTIAPDLHQRDHWNGNKLAVAPVLAGVVNWKED